MSIENKSYLKCALANLALLLGSLLVFALIFEFVVFRYIFKPADFEANAYRIDVIRYAPNQTGTYRFMNEIEAPYFINGEGWNSRHDQYMDDHRDGIYEDRALEANSTTILRLNRMAADAAASYGLPFLDL